MVQGNGFQGSGWVFEYTSEGIVVVVVVVVVGTVGAVVAEPAGVGTVTVSWEPAINRGTVEDLRWAAGSERRRGITDLSHVEPLRSERGRGAAGDAVHRRRVQDVH